MENNSSSNKIEGILSSLDKIRRAEPQPYLYTRLRARLEAGRVTVWDRVTTIISRPVIAVGGVFLVLIINIFAIYSHNNLSGNNDQPDVASTEDYSVVSSSFYDSENIKP